MEVTIAESAIYRLALALEPQLRKRSCLELATDAEEEVFLQAGALHGLDTGGEVRFIAPIPENAGIIASYEAIVDHILAEMAHRAHQARLGGISHSVEQRWWERVDDTAAKRGARAGGMAAATGGADAGSLLQSRVITARDFVANYAPPDGWVTVAGPGSAGVGLPVESRRAILKAAYGIQGIRSTGGGKGMNIDATAALAPVLRTGGFGKKGRAPGARSGSAGASTGKSRPHKRKAPLPASRAGDEWHDDSTPGSRLTRGGMALSQQLDYYTAAARETGSRHETSSTVGTAGWPSTAGYDAASSAARPAPKLKLKLKRRAAAEDEPQSWHGAVASAASDRLAGAGSSGDVTAGVAADSVGQDWRQQLSAAGALYSSGSAPVFEGGEDLFDIANLPTGDDETQGMADDVM